jgi:NADH-quinone oxidoreductase subunit F
MMMQCSKTAADIGGIGFPYSDERDKCPVDYIFRLLGCLRNSQCGKGVFCRDAAAQLHQIIGSIRSGEGKGGDVKLIREIAQASLLLADCEMTRTAAKEIIDLVESEEETWESHITRRRCPSLCCENLTLFYIDPSVCNGCGKCAGKCPESAIDGSPDYIHVIDRDMCTRCAACESECPVSAIKRADVAGIPPKTPDTPVPVGSFSAAPVNKGLRRGLRP